MNRFKALLHLGSNIFFSFSCYSHRWFRPMFCSYLSLKQTCHSNQKILFTFSKILLQNHVNIWQNVLAKSRKTAKCVHFAIDFAYCVQSAPSSADCTQQANLIAKCTHLANIHILSNIYIFTHTHTHQQTYQTLPGYGIKKQSQCTLMYNKSKITHSIAFLCRGI